MELPIERCQLRRHVAKEFTVTSPSPTVRRRELGARLRALRMERGLTVDDVAARMEVSPAKISRIETAARGVSLADVRFLCDLYGVSGAERDRLLILTRESRRRSWWQEYGLPDAVSTYIGLEDAAASIQQYRTSLIPGLLQTADYAEAAIAGVDPDLPGGQVGQFVQARLNRQALLSSEQPPELWVVLDEAALRRVVGGPAVMGAQLDALAERSRNPAVTVQVIAMDAGAHPGMDSSFSVLHFSDVSDVVFIEGLLGNFYLQGPQDLSRYQRTFDQLRAIALSPRDSRTLISAIAHDLSPDSAIPQT
jgi:transcriptional regulator with XRE-family HTH domain